MKELKKLLITIPLYAVFTLAEAGLLKLGVHLIRVMWLPKLPPLDYVAAVLVLVVLGTLVSTWKGGNALADLVRKF